MTIGMFSKYFHFRVLVFDQQVVLLDFINLAIIIVKNIHTTMLHVLSLFTFIIGCCFGNKEITGDISYSNTHLQIYIKTVNQTYPQNETLKNLF